MAGGQINGLSRELSLSINHLLSLGWTMPACTCNCSAVATSNAAAVESSDRTRIATATPPGTPIRQPWSTEFVNGGMTMPEVAFEASCLPQYQPVTRLKADLHRRLSTAAFEQRDEPYFHARSLENGMDSVSSFSFDDSAGTTTIELPTAATQHNMYLDPTLPPFPAPMEAFAASVGLAGTIQEASVGPGTNRSCLPIDEHAVFFGGAGGAYNMNDLPFIDFTADDLLSTCGSGWGAADYSLSLAVSAA